MRKIPKSFYDSPAWIACRDTYLKRHPFCEECLQHGMFTPAKHVHHVVWLTEDNYTDAKISLNHDNLRSLCLEHHNAIHKRRRSAAARRWSVDEHGAIVAKPDDAGC